ncbi:hypothetical protein MRX96_056654 [Rhipicephalus microplus]
MSLEGACRQNGRRHALYTRNRKPTEYVDFEFALHQDDRPVVFVAFARIHYRNYDAAHFSLAASGDPCSQKESTMKNDQCPVFYGIAAQGISMRERAAVEARQPRRRAAPPKARPSLRNAVDPT